LYQEGDIQHTNSWSGWSLRTCVPQVITEHTAIHQPSLGKYKTLGQRVFHNIIRKYEAKSIQNAEEIVCVSRFAQACLEKEFKFSDSRVIYNGIDTRLFRPVILPNNPYRVDEDKVHILFSGNLTTLKGADLLSGIMDTLDDRFVLLVVHGFKQKMRISGKRIISYGTLSEDEMVKVYNACDIFLTPSRLEGFGLSVAEAMACGKPVVATNCSSLPELVEDNKGGFLCRVDNLNDFSEKIRYLGENEEERRNMGVFNRERVNQLFTIEKMVNNYIRLYRSLL
jgi:glycosyltransferase involved in cell wall biosynthesis